MALPKGGDSGLATGMKPETSENNAGKLETPRRNRQ
jgi:hypothetical protein